MEYQGVRTLMANLFGSDDRFMGIMGGGMVSGRLSTQAEANAGTPVVVLELDAAQHLFGLINPLGHVIRIGGKPFRVVGVYQRSQNFLEPPGAPKIAAVIPFESARRAFTIDDTNQLVIAAKPKPEVSVSQAIEAVTLQLRRMRGIRTGEPNTFDIVTADQILGVDGGRDRCHGHHDGVGHQPHAGDRRPQGAGRHPAGRAVAIPAGGCYAHRGGRRPGSRPAWAQARR